MKFLEVRFRQPDWMLHPMQEFIRHGDVVVYEELRAWNLLPDEEIEYELFYVEVTDRDRYRAAVDDVASILEYDITPIDDNSLYAYARQQTRKEDLLFREAFATLELVVVPPIVYDDEAAMTMTIVGDGENLQTLLDGVPDEIACDVLEIGEYDSRYGTVATALTDRQREAIAAATDVGYYDVPRTGSVADVADVLGCAPSTASNHLQKAEATVIRRLANGRQDLR
ncbi:helix-turn-helix domain-containing protein [Natribaculum luteum]|uniref:Helix-turn-helix domain-containing protein n=1 Tax=Natribaculum luteum TaxID=1586232 RepID=A0ABD5NWM6_9EURY|nr:helix-turn-helix domain-containing protein [Natribaculum luteum]